MDPFITAWDFIVWADLADVGIRAETAVAAACDAVREHMCQTITQVVNDPITLVGSDTRALLLPELPVTAVVSVTLNGVAVTDWTLDPLGSGILWRDGYGYWPRCQKFVVTYTHGYAPADIPGNVRLVTLRLAQAEYDQPGAIQQQTAGPFSVTYAPASTLLDTLPVLKRVPMP